MLFFDLALVGKRELVEVHGVIIKAEKAAS
jgi:hypothetical protein